ncbi:MAG: PHP domain-containing protein [Deltaproteobacteria bacterium]
MNKPTRTGLMSACCDLHTHTIASDGSDTPTRLVQLAHAAGLAGISVTDHDTVSGIPEAIEAGRRLGVEVLPGVELSVIAPSGNMHILGYGIDTHSPNLLALLEKVQQARAGRNARILELLRAAGCPLSMEEVERAAGGGQIGRPHFARVLVEKGYVSSTGEAFARFLRKGAVAYAPKAVITPVEALRILHASGGATVLAHPLTLNCPGPDDLERIVSDLASAGLDGLECHYSEHTPSFTCTCLDIAKRYGLIPTGGSDYHGAAKPAISLGKGKGDLCVPARCLAEIRKRAEEKRASR